MSAPDLIDKVTIRMKIGDLLEVEYEGSVTHFAGVVSAVSAAGNKIPNLSDPVKPHVLPEQSKDTPNFTTSDFAQRLNVKTGSQLAMAAAAKLWFTDGKDRLERLEMLEEMQAATSYYKQSFNRNLTPYLNTLTKSGKLRQIGKDVYSVSADTEREIRSLIEDAD